MVGSQVAGILDQFRDHGRTRHRRIVRGDVYDTKDFSVGEIVVSLLARWPNKSVSPVMKVMKKTFMGKNGSRYGGFWAQGVDVGTLFRVIEGIRAPGVDVVKDNSVFVDVRRGSNYRDPEMQITRR